MPEISPLHEAAIYGFTGLIGTIIVIALLFVLTAV